MVCCLAACGKVKAEGNPEKKKEAQIGTPICASGAWVQPSCYRGALNAASAVNVKSMLTTLSPARLTVLVMVAVGLAHALIV